VSSVPSSTVPSNPVPSNTVPSNTVANEAGNYRFVPGISPYSGGVRADAGYRIVHTTLRTPPPWQQGFASADGVIGAAGRDIASLCSVELRCPQPHSFDGFIEFNDEYRQALSSRDLLLTGGVNPVARTNVAPVVSPPAATTMFGFGYTDTDPWEDGSPSFVIAGAGDIRDQSELTPEAIVRAGDLWADAGAQRAGVVLDEMEARMAALEVSWTDATMVDIYCAESVHGVLESVVLARMGSAAGLGVHWHLAAPPIAGLTFEMDLRGGTVEHWV
jgi:hypothetical protein